MKISRVRRHLILVLLGMLVAMCAGCLGLSQGNKRTWSDAPNPTVGSEANERNTQPPAVKASAPAQTVASEGKTIPARASNEPARVGLPEEEKAKTLALDLAKANPNVKKLKVCHDKKSDEWWLTLYEDAGDHFQLRQYTWSVQLDQPEEFLVLKRISKSKLESDLTASDYDRICQVVKYEPGGRLPAVAAQESAAPHSNSNEVLSRSTKPIPVSDPEKKPVRKPDASREATKAQASAATTAKPEGIAQPQTNMVVAAVRASAKPSASAEAVRKPVSPPNREAYVQASARNSPTEITPLRETASVDRPVATRKSPEKAESSKARIVSDAGVFSLAAVRPGAKHAISRRDSKPRPNREESGNSLAGGGKSAPLSDADGSLTGRDRKSGLMSVDKTDDQSRDVPTSFVFVYGSGMNHQELLSWLKANNYDSNVILDAAPGVLNEYDLVWNYYSPSRGGGTVNLEPKKNSSVWGLLVEVEDRGLRALDQKEGHPLYYTRGDNRVSVRRVNDGRTVFAWLYRAKPNRSGVRNVWPTTDYKQRIVDAANFWQFPRRYVEKLESLPTR
jgi:gamma-glutamylcyclotransferase (GGCT)/AIG2-like uncharacterized protein YtfP